MMVGRRRFSYLMHVAGILLPLLLSTSCRQGRVTMSSDGGDTLHMKYAKNILIVREPTYTRVELLDPWNAGRLLHTYLLVPLTAPPSTHDDDPLYSQATVVHVPLQRSVVFNTAHVSLLQMLNALDRICGVADMKYMKVNGLKNMGIADCGDSMNPDIERLVDLRADAVLLSPFENNGGYGKLERIGVPIIECAEYMETSALGRAEWVRFYGLLYGCEHEADSLFSLVEQEYIRLKDEAKQFSTSPKILSERLTGSTWYVPGGRSSMGRLFADAGASYAWADDNHSGSLSLSLETVIDKSGDVDIWVMNDMGAAPLTYDVLAAEHHAYATIKAFKDRNVYFVNSMQVPYFEEVTFRPDYLLREFISLLHTDKGDKNLRYYRKVN